ncbi:hypothetical protein EJB05_01737 [Eragrostis curvula]|uniref:Uncharacterized protein n=1 Tax=Eragrostis curvula TaxID=38414 RepID=A0A5J9WR15_9POAL|nr:hypothetical protein EJB05_01737 [Eragrostis curvula]
MSSLTTINEVNLRRRDHHDDGRVTTTRSFSVEDDSVSQHDHGEVDLRQRFSLPAAGLNQVNRFQELFQDFDKAKHIIIRVEEGSYRQQAREVASNK